MPRYNEFLRDTQQLRRNVVAGMPNWEAVLEQNKQGFALDWVDRTDFLAEYPLALTRDQYIDKLFSTLGVMPTPEERNQAVFAWDALGSLKEKRARTIRAVVDTGGAFNEEYNPAFVLMQYFGYLRRNPNDAPDNDFSGYDFWLDKLTAFSRPGEDVRNAQVALARVKRAEMVKAFLASIEYRQRFGGGVPLPIGPSSIGSLKVRRHSTADPAGGGVNSQQKRSSSKHEPPSWPGAERVNKEIGK